MTTPPKRGLREAVVAFRNRNFTLFWSGALISNIGTWMQNITVPFALLVHTLIVLWYTRHGHHPADIDDRRTAQPWYRTKTEPAFEDMVIKLRRTLIAARFSVSRPAQRVALLSGALGRLRPPG